MKTNVIAVLLFLALGRAVSSAAEITIEHADRGAYELFTDGTYHKSPGGLFAVGAVDRSFFGIGDGPLEIQRLYATFDLSGLTGDVTGAQLRIWMKDGDYKSNAASETLGLFDVDADANGLLADTINAQTTHEDLGSGVSYGEGMLTSSDVGGYVSLDLNSAAIADINAALGQTSWVVGGALQTVDGSYGALFYEGLFNSAGVHLPTQLVLTGVTVPEPSTLALLGLAGCGLLGRRRK